MTSFRIFELDTSTSNNRKSTTISVPNFEIRPRRAVKVELVACAAKLFLFLFERVPRRTCYCEKYFTRKI